MKYGAALRLVLSGLLLAALASCGGGSAVTNGRSGALEAAQPGGPGPAALPHYAPGELKPSPAPGRPAGLSLVDPPVQPVELGSERAASAAGLESLWPPLPDDRNPQRQTSVAYADPADPASPAAKSANVTTGAGKATLSAGPKTVSWAYYGIPITGTKTPATLQISGSIITKGNGFKSGIYVGLADYTAQRWRIDPNVYSLALPASITFTPGENYHSPGKKLYVLIATYNNDVAEITNIQTSGDDSNVAPTAKLTSTPQVNFAPANFTLDASASTDSDGQIVKYEFNFDDGAGFVDNGAVATKPHVFNTAGAYDCQVRVTDEGNLSSTATFTVIAVDPGSFLPLSWYQARINAGLGDATMGQADNVGLGLSYQYYFPNTRDFKTQLPAFFSGWYAAPEDFPLGVKQEGDVIHSATGLQDLFLDANEQYMGNHVIARQNFNPTLDPTKPLSTAIAAFVTAAGGTAQPGVYEAAVVSMPLPQQNVLARLFYACSDAMTRRNAGLASIGLTDPQDIQDVFDNIHGDPLGGFICLTNAQYIGAVYNVGSGNYLLAGFPYGDTLFTGAAEMTDALDKLTTFQQTGPAWANINLTVDTPVGQLVISGTGNDTHGIVAPDGQAVLIDLGGNDTYNCQAGGTASGANGVSLCVDMSGNDTYNRIDDPLDVDRTQNPSNDNTCQQGGGRLGIGMLVDYSGDDAYHSVRMSQGGAVFGVGLLADFDGTDTYDMEAMGQGGAFAGIGILFDKAGGDSYTGWSKVQGFGGLMGVGLLVDEGMSTDDYVAMPDEDAAKPEYIADANSHKNASFAQGAALGLPRGLLQLNTTPPQIEVGGGGFGLLFDAGGSDNYTCGWLGQGAGYFEGTGLLIDNAGDDTYAGYTYSQGVAYNAGLACLMDLNGSDHYTTTSGVGIGAADFLGVSWLIDLQGADFYDIATTGLGAANRNGMGYFLDYQGDDSFSGHTSGYQDTALGRANLGGTGSDDTKPGYGIFVDNAGTDTYALPFANMAGASPQLPGDNHSWVRKVDGTYVNGRGSGIDVGP